MEEQTVVGGTREEAETTLGIWNRVPDSDLEETISESRGTSQTVFSLYGQTEDRPLRTPGHRGVWWTDRGQTAGDTQEQRVVWTEVRSLTPSRNEQRGLWGRT